MENITLPSVLQCARYINSPSRRDERLVKDYEFDLYLGGDRDVFVDGKHFHLSKGFMYFKRPGEKVAGYGDYNMYMLTLDFAHNLNLTLPYYRNHGGDIQSHSRIEALAGLPSVFFSYHAKELSDIYEGIISCTYPSVKNPELENMYIEEFLFLVFADAARYRREQLTSSFISTASHVQSACLYINQNYAKDITLEMIADHVSLNKNYLVRIFKNELGTTPNKYLVDTRLQYAHALLMQTDETVASIATRCGFNTPSYFIKCFKKHFGESPMAYKTTKSDS